MLDMPGVTAVWDALPEARIVGGAVRDTLIGRVVADVDFASPLRPEAVLARLREARIKTVPTGLAHGTVTAVAAGRGFEITTLRRDVRTDGRHAVVAFTDDWQDDASRRDFTINAMSASRDGTVFDYFEGRADLAAGRVRFVGDPATRIAEDYLRVLRFFRFFARYGRGEADAAALAAITALASGIGQLSVERVWSEIKLLLGAADPGAAVALMQSTGVLSMVLPGADAAALQALLARGAPAEPLLRLAVLAVEEPATLAARLKLSGQEQERLTALRGSNTLLPDADDADLRRALANEDAAILIARSWAAQDATPGWNTLRRRLAAMPRPVFPLQGRDLTRLGIPPGPKIGRILAEIRDWWLAGGCIADAAACRAQIDKVK